MDSTSKINERLLREYEDAGFITHAKIARTDEGYVLVVRLSWKVGDLIVYNQRGAPRAWGSLDRLLRYLGETIPSVKAFDLVLDEPLKLPGELSPPAKPAPAPAKAAPRATKQAAPARKVVAKALAAKSAAAKPKAGVKPGRKLARA